MRLSTLLLATALVSVPVSAAAAPFSALYVFGDSLSDNGNLSAAVAASLGIVVPAPPYAPGVVSNGPVAVQYLAASLGLPPLAPAVLGGTNYAVAGAATGPVAFPLPGDPTNTADNIAEAIGLPLPVPTGILNAQVPTFLAGAPPADIASSLFVVWGGANDLAISFASGAPNPAVATDAAARIGMAIDLLYGAGARHFLVPNLPDTGLTPGSIVPTFDTAASTLFNQALAAQLALRSATLPGIQLTAFDTYAFFNAVIDDPAAFGFANVSEPCYVGPLLGVGIPTSVCMDDDAYLFWDGSHPTTRAHQLLGQQFAAALEDQAAVPEPATMTLALLGVAAVVSRRRRRDGRRFDS